MADRGRKVAGALRAAKNSLQEREILRFGAGRGARRRLAVKDAEIAALRRELARTRGGVGQTGTNGSPVFFVLGQQKSGTTWLMRTLDAHPEILCRGEGKLFDINSSNSLHGALARVAIAGIFRHGAGLLRRTL